MNLKKTSHYICGPYPTIGLVGDAQKRELITCDCTSQFWGVKGESAEFESNILLIAEDNLLRTREYSNELRLYASERQMRARIHILIETMTQLENFQYLHALGVGSVIFNVPDMMDCRGKFDERGVRSRVSKIATDFEANQQARIVIDVQKASKFWQRFEIPRVGTYEDLLQPGVLDDLATKFWLE